MPFWNTQNLFHSGRPRLSWPLIMHKKKDIAGFVASLSMNCVYDIGLAHVVAKLRTAQNYGM